MSFSANRAVKPCRHRAKSQAPITRGTPAVRLACPRGLANAATGDRSGAGAVGHARLGRLGQPRSGTAAWLEGVQRLQRGVTKDCTGMLGTAGAGIRRWRPGHSVQRRGSSGWPAERPGSPGMTNAAQDRPRAGKRRRLERSGQERQGQAAVQARAWTVGVVRQRERGGMKGWAASWQHRDKFDPMLRRHSLGKPPTWQTFFAKFAALEPPPRSPGAGESSVKNSPRG
jgi:hypothetical protein